jgi:phosphate transport system protein
MSHYEERLEKDLAQIRTHLAQIAAAVEKALKDAVHALLTGDGRLAYQTILGDLPINRSVRDLDRRCYGFIAVHLPSAGHLRYISSVMRTNIALERIGDYAVTIGREAVQLEGPPSNTMAREMELMADESRNMLGQAVAAFGQGNAEAARATMAIADQVERTYDTAFTELMQEEGRRHVRDLFAYLVIFNMLERVSDQAKNLCEEAVFAATGESKPEKVYRILFLDASGACLAPLAEAIARKRFPHSGAYASAGKTPAAALEPATAAFMADRDLQPPDAPPRGLTLTPAELADFHLVVSLQGPVKDYLPKVPFHTTALEWEVGEPPCDLDPEAARAALEDIYRGLAARISELMETLRGEGGQ